MRKRKRKVTFIIDDLPDFIEKNAKVLKSGERIFYHLPHWFEEIDNKWQIHHINNLPEELKQAITRSGLGGDNKKKVTSTQYPQTYKESYDGKDTLSGDQ